MVNKDKVGFYYNKVRVKTYFYLKQNRIRKSMRKLKFFVSVLLAAWLVIGILLTPIVTGTIQNFGAFVKSSEWNLSGYAFLLLILMILAATLFVLKAKGLFDRIVASLFLLFHWFPALAWVLEPSLYVMAFPVGAFVLLCSPLNPLFIFPPTRELLEIVILDALKVPAMLWFLGMSLFPIGLIIFIVALIQLLRGKGVVKTGLYSVVRHPQYLGILAVTFGFLFLGTSLRLVSLMSWVILVLAYVWLGKREEAILQEKHGDEYLAYKRRVPFILPLRTKVRICQKQN